ncbi:MAG: DUF2934 domain-containing protein [Magnetococcus sp. WYHC-3]
MSNDISLDEKIRIRAYYLAEKDGFPAGREQEYWYRAEQELKAELNTAQAASTGSQRSRTKAAEDHPVAEKCDTKSGGKRCAPKAAMRPADAPKAPGPVKAIETPKAPEPVKAVETPKAPEPVKAVETPKAPEPVKAAPAPAAAPKAAAAPAKPAAVEELKLAPPAASKPVEAPRAEAPKAATRKASGKAGAAKA